MAHICYAIVPPHNINDYPPTMGTSQKKAIGTKRFRQNQALFVRCTAVETAIKNQIAVAVHKVFLSLLVEQLMGFGQVTALQIIQHIYKS